MRRHCVWGILCIWGTGAISSKLNYINFRLELLPSIWAWCILFNLWQHSPILSMNKARVCSLRRAVSLTPLSHSHMHLDISQVSRVPELGINHHNILYIDLQSLASSCLMQTLLDIGVMCMAKGTSVLCAIIERFPHTRLLTLHSHVVFCMMMVGFSTVRSSTISLLIHMNRISMWKTDVGLRQNLGKHAGLSLGLMFVASWIPALWYLPRGPGYGQGQCFCESISSCLLFVFSSSSWHFVTFFSTLVLQHLFTCGLTGLWSQALIALVAGCFNTHTHLLNEAIFIYQNLSWTAAISMYTADMF